MAKKNPYAEPEWDWDESIEPAEMEWRWVRALHWYRCNADPKKKKAWVLDYVKKHLKKEKVADYRNAKNSLYDDAGGLCRIKMTGCKNKVLDSKIKDALAAIKDDCKKQNKKTVVVKPTIPIKQRIADQVSEYMDEVNQQIDKIIRYPNTASKTWWDIRGWMQKEKIKSMQATEIMKEIRGMLNEARAAYQKEDPQLVEAYSFMKPKYLHKYVSFLERLVRGAENHINAVKPKTKTSRKNSDPEKMVKKLPYLKEGEKIKVKSEHPKKIIGADALFVYNEVSRLLYVYQSRVGNGGLIVNGASIDHFDPNRSFIKKLRSPEHTINMVKRLTKKHILEEVEKITTVKKPIRPRLNANCIIVRVI